MTEQVWSAIQTILRRPLREHRQHQRSRRLHRRQRKALALKGSTIPFRPAEDARVWDGMRGIQKASIISYLTAFVRMSAPTGKVASRPEGAWPDNTYSTPQKKLPSTRSRLLSCMCRPRPTVTVLWIFRTSDVNAVGDLLDMTAYPRIDIQAGGSADTVLEGLNRLIELTVPNRKSGKLGRSGISGRGRLADQPDVVDHQQIDAIVR